MTLELLCACEEDLSYPQFIDMRLFLLGDFRDQQCVYELEKETPAR